MASPPPVHENPRETPHLDCIHCGICLSACPTYLHTGNEADSPRGRILLINAMRQRRVDAASASFRSHMGLCLECRACETSCPSGVRFSSMMDLARIEILRRGKPSVRAAMLRWIILQKIFPSRAALHSCFLLLKFYQRSGIRRLVQASGIMRLLPVRLAALEALLPEIPAKYNFVKGAGPPGAERALLFEGCIMPEIFGPVHEATVRVLQRQGVHVEMPPRQKCCGALHLHMGDVESARRLARRNIEVFGDKASGAIIVNAAGCGAMLKEYGDLLADDPAFAQRARDFSRRVCDISEYLDGRGIDRNMTPLDLKVAYDDPCHLLHAQRVRTAPRNLLRSIPGLQLLELRDADRCCGSAGIYNITQPEMSQRILDEKIANIIRSGAQVVASGNPGCLLQIRAGIRSHNLRIRVAHPVELLDQAYGPKS